MIIDKSTKGFITRSDSDWTGEDVYVVPDGSPLAEQYTTTYALYGPEGITLRDDCGMLKSIIVSGVLKESSAEEQIAKLKKVLAETDYRIIKCYEYQLVGEQLPYDMVTLHTERQATRDEINRLEGEAP